MSDLQAAIKFILDPRHETDPSGLLRDSASLPAGLLKLFQINHRSTSGKISANPSAKKSTNPTERLRASLVARGERVVGLFRRWDLNGDGIISKEEVIAP